MDLLYKILYDSFAVFIFDIYIWFFVQYGGICAMTLEEERKALEEQWRTLEQERRSFSRRVEIEDRRLEQQQKLFDMKFKILEEELAKLATEKEQVRKQKEFYNKVSDFASHGSNTHNSASNVVKGDMFFSGVGSKQSIKKRYKDLIKIYHPDNLDGDQHTVQEINNEYSKLCAIYKI